MSTHQTDSVLAYNATLLKSSADSHIRTLGFARYVAWVVLVVVILMTVVLSTYTGSLAQRELIAKQEEFSLLLADNLNNHIYRRFALPTILGFGRIELRLEFQFKRLDEIIKSTIHGLNVKHLRIFGDNNTVSYSTDREEAGKIIESPDIAAAIQKESAVFTIDSSLPFWKAFFMFPSLPADSYILRTTYPLRLETQPGEEGDSHFMGVLEFTRDITRDIESAIRFQQLVLMATMLTSSFLMVFLLFFIRRAERALAARMNEEQRLLKELHQHEKLASMGRVIASIAHEIRNPLGIIQSSAELLLKQENTNPKVLHKIMQAIYDEARRLSQTVSDFLDYARPRQLNKNEIHLENILAQALAFLEPDLKNKNVSISLEGMEQCVANGDKDLLYRVFYNIIVNAVQAMKDGGKITISLKRFENNDGAFIVFHDSGPGFPEGDLTKALDPFFTTKDGGTGLGLAIVNSIVNSHGGTLSLANAEEGGAIITVKLPD